MKSVRRVDSMVARRHRCFLICAAPLLLVSLLLLMVDSPGSGIDTSLSLQRVGRVSEETQDEWGKVLRKGHIAAVNFFHKGLAEKYEVIFTSGHVAAAKPIIPEGPLGVQHYHQVNYDDLDSHEHKTLRRAKWEYQGFSEIVGFHLDRILGFNRKPPIVGRLLSSHTVYATDSSWRGFLHRLMPAFDIPFALVPWVDGLQRAVPSLEIRDYLLDNSTKELSSSDKVKAADASDKLVFDYLVDDHDTQGAQNWKADISGKLLHWDTGLGWRCGPFPKTSCLDILCGTKEWKGVAHRDPNPKYCGRICRFRKSTVDLLRSWQAEEDVKQRLPYQLMLSLREDPIYPVFNYGLYSYRSKDAPPTAANYIHLNPEVFFYGMESRLKHLIEHIDECEEKLGSRVYLDE